MGGAVVFVITLASFVTGIINKFILANEAIMDGKLVYLQTIVFILVIACLVQFVEMFLKKSMPSLYQALGVYLPLITTNCAVLGVAITNVQKSYSILEGVINGVGTSVGFLIAIVILAGIREKMEYNDHLLILTNILRTLSYMLGSFLSCFVVMNQISIIILSHGSWPSSSYFFPRKVTQA